MGELIFDSRSIVDQRIDIISCASRLIRIETFGSTIEESIVPGRALVKIDTMIWTVMDQDSIVPELSDRMKIAIAAIANDDQASWSALADYLAENMFQDR